jgi:GWxTD domain-containing protein
MPVGRTIVTLALCLLLTPLARADKLDKDSKKWLEDVGTIILPDEEKTFKGLKDKADRDEFERIFWARRNPKGPEAQENQFRTSFEKAKADADQKFKVAGTAGSATDCGRVFLLLGEPNDVKKTSLGEEAEGPRSPETWTFKNRPGITFPDGHMEITFDGACQLPPGSKLREQLTRIAELKIVSPNINYRPGSDGRLVKLPDLLPKPTPIQALLKEPRQDFPAAVEPSMFLKSPDGAAYMAGLVRGDASALSVQAAGDKKTLKLLVAAQAVDDAGRSFSSPDRETTAVVGGDGSFLVSYGLALKAGTYNLKVAVLDPKSGKGSASTSSLKVPDYNTGELSMSSLLILQDVQTNQTKDPQDPLADFSLGTARLVPRFGNVFTPADSLQIICAFYNARVEPTTGKAALVVSFLLTKDGKTIAKADDATYDTTNASHSIGPVPLAKYSPGKYVCQIKVRDDVAKKEYTEEATFEIKS